MDVIERAKPLLNGKDLQELGYAAGPLYREILDKTFAAQLNGEITDKDQAISFVKKRFPL